MTMIDRVLVMRPSGCLVGPGSFVISRWSVCLNDYLRLLSPAQSELFACDGAPLWAQRSAHPRWMCRQKQAFSQSFRQHRFSTPESKTRESYVPYTPALHYARCAALPSNCCRQPGGAQHDWARTCQYTKTTARK